MANTSYGDNWRNQVGPQAAPNTPEREPGQPGRSRNKPRELPPVRITSQFRESRNMTYELECSGVSLVLRVFYPIPDSPNEWRIEARAGQVQDGGVATASARSRRLALDGIAGCWDASVPKAVAGVDWKAVNEALTAVRAL